VHSAAAAAAATAAKEVYSYQEVYMAGISIYHSSVSETSTNTFRFLSDVDIKLHAKIATDITDSLFTAGKNIFLNQCR